MKHCLIIFGSKNKAEKNQEPIQKKLKEKLAVVFRINEGKDQYQKEKDSD